MPFDWTPDYVESSVSWCTKKYVFQKIMTHIILRKDFVGYVNGIQVDNRALLVDPYSSETQKHNPFFSYWE